MGIFFERLLGATRVGCAFLLISACSSGPRGACSDEGPLRTVCGFENPEDLAWASGHDALVVSQMRRAGIGGSLASWTKDADRPRRLWPLARTPGIAAGPAGGDPSCPPPAPEEFAPHGLFVAPSGLYVVNHGGRESVEIFSLSGFGEALGARWIGCVELPANGSANDVAVGPHGEILVSNRSSPGQMLPASLLSRLGVSTGQVLLWRAGEGWQPVPGSEASAPNGVAIAPDGAWLFYAESGASRIVRMRPDGSERAYAKVQGRPDNLSWADDHTLYVASHLSSLQLALCLQREVCRAPWEIFEIDAETLEVRSILTHAGERIGAAATAEAASGDVYLSAVFGDRIAVWSPRRQDG